MRGEANCVIQRFVAGDPRPTAPPPPRPSLAMVVLEAVDRLALDPAQSSFGRDADPGRVDPCRDGHSFDPAGAALVVDVVVCTDRDADPGVLVQRGHGVDVADEVALGRRIVASARSDERFANVVRLMILT